MVIIRNLHQVLALRVCPEERNRGRVRRWKWDPRYSATGSSAQWLVTDKGQGRMVSQSHSNWSHRVQGLSRVQKMSPESCGT